LLRVVPVVVAVVLLLLLLLVAVTASWGSVVWQMLGAVALSQMLGHHLLCCGVRCHKR
jgi:hypothetical protein